MEGTEAIEIVIVGAGICGLATALALHRKGIRCLILERSETLRASGAGITVRTNAWCALEQLGVASKLRQTALPLRGFRNKWLDTGKEQEFTFGIWETRCLRRSDLINTLAESLPCGTIRFGCQVLSVELDPITSFSVIQLNNGSVITAKILIGCDGVSSVVAGYLGLQPPKLSSSWEVRGFTKYPNGHDFGTDFVHVNGHHNAIGRIPINDKLVHWFVTRQGNFRGVSKDTKSIQKATIQSIKGFPQNMVDMIAKSDLDSVSMARLSYRPPWDILLRSFCKGTVTVAGDAMHVMGPFLGQGGSAGIEDAIILARCLSKVKFDQTLHQTSGGQILVKIEKALDEYVKQRRTRLVWLTTQNYLSGLLFENSSFLVKFVCIILMAVLFRDPNGHCKYNCGAL